MGPADLSTLLSFIPKNKAPELLSGLEDDATAFRINPDLAVVQSIDFITPIVNDPYSFGGIAAANALSDIYAMGATPIFALNVVSFPVNSMPMETLGAILTGGVDKAKEAGITITGGHSITDSSPKYGLTVTGLVHPEKLIRKTGARPGDALILTKPLGTGILATALEMELINSDVESILINVMLELNKRAAEIMSNFPVHACTDVTGYGLLGHLREMLGNSLTAILDYPSIPILPQVWDVLKYGGISSGAHANARYLREHVEWPQDLREQEQFVLYDPQTSGGLLIAISEDHVPSFISALEAVDTLAASKIGRIEARKKSPIEVKG